MLKKIIAFALANMHEALVQFDMQTLDIDLRSMK